MYALGAGAAGALRVSPCVMSYARAMNFVCTVRRTPAATARAGRERERARSWDGHVLFSALAGPRSAVIFRVPFWANGRGMSRGR